MQYIAVRYVFVRMLGLSVSLLQQFYAHPPALPAFLLYLPFPTFFLFNSTLRNSGLRYQFPDIDFLTDSRHTKCSALYPSNVALHVCVWIEVENDIEVEVEVEVREEFMPS